MKLAVMFRATLVAVTLVVLVTRPAGASFFPLSRTISNMGQTFPPVAVLALAVPALGFGAGPTLVALFLYGLLPIFENAITGFSTLPPATMEAARGAWFESLAKAHKSRITIGHAGYSHGYYRVV